MCTIIKLFVKTFQPDPSKTAWLVCNYVATTHVAYRLVFVIYCSIFIANIVSFILNMCTWENRKQQQHNTLAIWNPCHWLHGRRLLLKSGGDIACPDHEAHFVLAWTQQVYSCKFLILYDRWHAAFWSHKSLKLIWPSIDHLFIKCKQTERN